MIHDATGGSGAIHLDVNACPVKGIACMVAARYGVPLLAVTNRSLRI
jgi:uncharacterized protein YaiI (UPF0178 family)